MTMNTLKIITLLTALLSSPVFSLQLMNESELAATYGQAIFEVSENLVKQGDGSELNMLRITMGAHIEINANVDELALGRYWRPEGTNCTGGAGGDKICYNNIVPVDYNDNIAWACTANPCGSVGLGDAEYESSLLTHGAAVSFFDYPGGFEPDAGVDIKLRDITMGQVIDIGDGLYELTPFVQDNPYIEFAFDESSGVQQLVGFRVGAENSYGYQGNIIDVISGFIEPTITAEIELPIIGGLGSLELEAFLGGVRTIGWLDSSNLTLYAVNGALVNLLVSDPESVLDESPTAQLFPVQSNYLDNTSAFFISMGSRSIQWSEVQGFSPEVTFPGFWLNMGGDGGLISFTQNGDHPNNYFPGHPNFQLYGANTNYGDATTRPSWSQTYNN